MKRRDFLRSLAAGAAATVAPAVTPLEPAAGTAGILGSGFGLAVVKQEGASIELDVASIPYGTSIEITSFSMAAPVEDA